MQFIFSERSQEWIRNKLSQIDCYNIKVTMHLPSLPLQTCMFWQKKTNLLNNINKFNDLKKNLNVLNQNEVRTLAYFLTLKLCLAHNTSGGDLNPAVQIREMQCAMDFSRRC